MLSALPIKLLFQNQLLVCASDEDVFEEGIYDWLEQNESLLT